MVYDIIASCVASSENVARVAVRFLEARPRPENNLFEIRVSKRVIGDSDRQIFSFTLMLKR